MMFSLCSFAATSATALLLLFQPTHGFISTTPALVRASRGSCPTAAATTRMSYAPKNVQDVWDNHLAAFGGKDVSDSLGAGRCDSNSLLTGIPI